MTTTTDRPIIFGAESIRAILDGRKTQTRRVVKPQPRDPRTNFHFSLDGVWLLERRGYENYAARSEDGMSITCPYTVGQRLWVRETWTRARTWTGKPWIYKAELTAEEWARREEIAKRNTPDPSGYVLRWNSPIFMPRRASRITLEVTGVRAERVQDITYDDILAEGWNSRTSEPITDGTAGEDARAWYAALWDRINARRGLANQNGDIAWLDWASNPWVWVVEFRRIQ